MTDEQMSEAQIVKQLAFVAQFMRISDLTQRAKCLGIVWQHPKISTREDSNKFVLWTECLEVVLDLDFHKFLPIRDSDVRAAEREPAMSNGAIVCQYHRKIICDFLEMQEVRNVWSLSDENKLSLLTGIINFGTSISMPLGKKRRRRYLRLAAKAILKQRTAQAAADSSQLRTPHKAKTNAEILPFQHRATLERSVTQKDIDDFYDCPQWKRLSYDAKKQHGRRCMCCGATPDTGAVIHTDHIKPIRYFWSLRFDPNNLQVLCSDCNYGKGSRDQSDWRTRESRLIPRQGVSDL